MPILAEAPVFPPTDFLVTKPTLLLFPFRTFAMLPVLAFTLAFTVACALAEFRSALDLFKALEFRFGLYPVMLVAVLLMMLEEDTFALLGLFVAEALIVAVDLTLTCVNM